MRPSDSIVFLHRARTTGRTGAGTASAPPRPRRLLEHAGCRQGADSIYSCAGSDSRCASYQCRRVPPAARPRARPAQLRQAGVEVMPVFALGCRIRADPSGGDSTSCSSLRSIGRISRGSPSSAAAARKTYRVLPAARHARPRSGGPDPRRPERRRPQQGGRADGEGRAGDPALEQPTSARSDRRSVASCQCFRTPYLNAENWWLAD